MASVLLPALTRGIQSLKTISEKNRGAAVLMDNWLPTTSGAKLRGGKAKRSNMGGYVPHSYIKHQDGTQKKLFAVANGVLRDITPVFPAPNHETIPAAILSGLGAGVYSSVQFATPGNQFAIAVNGTAKYLIYNRVANTWEQNPGAVALSPDDSETFNFVWAYNKALYFAVNNSTKVKYLGPDAIGGASSIYDLTSQFSLGGAILFGSAWSADSGAGPDDYNVFVSTEGDVVVASGINPSDTGWTVVNRYQIPKPLHKNGHFRVGGDLLIETVEGIIALSEVFRKDTKALSLAAITANIKPDWIKEVSKAVNKNWPCVRWDSAGYLIVSVPAVYALTGSGTALVDISKPKTWAVNLETGAAGIIRDWDIQSFVDFDGRGFFGSSDGYIYEANVGGNDAGVPITAYAVWWPDDLGTRAYKAFDQAKVYFEHSAPLNPRVGASVDYTIDSPHYLTAATLNTNEGVWDTSTWNNAVWADLSKRDITANWASLSCSGEVISVSVALVSNMANDPNVEMRECVLTFTEGGMAVSSTDGLVIDRSEVTGFSPVSVDGNEYKVRVIVHD